MYADSNVLEGKGTGDAGAASGTDDDDDSQSMPEHVRGAISLAGDGIEDILIPLDSDWDPNGFYQG